MKNPKNIILFLIAIFLISCQEKNNQIYFQGFNTKNNLSDFRFVDNEKWQWSEDDNKNGYLQLLEPNTYKPKVRSPQSIAIIDDYYFNDFVLEVDLMQKPVNHDCKGEDCIICKHRDMCIFWNFQDSTKFYYAHIGAQCDPVSHQIHIVNDAPRTAITSKRSNGVEWGTNVWNHVKVVHIKGDTKIYFNDMEEPVLEATDSTFMGGYIGFGSFDEVGNIDNIAITSNNYKIQKSELFEMK